MDLCAFEASTGCTMSSRSVSVELWSDIVTKRKKKSLSRWQAFGVLTAWETEAEDHMSFRVQASVASSQVLAENSSRDFK